MNDVKFSFELANMILGYLGKRPYEEVFQIIQRIEAEHKKNTDADAVQAAMTAAEANNDERTDNN